MPDIFMETHREQIILFAARNNVPAIYSQSVFVRDGGLLSYGADRVDIFRRSASYVDRILKGAKPGELPEVTCGWLFIFSATSDSTRPPGTMSCTQLPSGLFVPIRQVPGRCINAIALLNPSRVTRSERPRCSE